MAKGPVWNEPFLERKRVQCLRVHGNIPSMVRMSSELCKPFIIERTIFGRRWHYLLHGAHLQNKRVYSCGLHGHMISHMVWS